MKIVQLSMQGESSASGSVTPSLSYPSSGAVAIPMTNDYLFRAFLQRNNRALKGLIGALLYLDPEEIISVEITNPIVLGNSADDKMFILDIRVRLNGNEIIDIEMQVINQYNWVDRSLSYLCRNFDHLESGESYQDIHPVIQIGILNFTLFEGRPEFYATYQLLNVKDYALYSDKLRLSVLDLTCIDMATEEDKLHQLDYWASLFKATTWEEITMLAEKNEYIAEAATAVYQLTQDERVRMECEAREDYYRTQLGIQRKLARLEELEKKKDELLDNLEETESNLKEARSSLEETEGKLEETEGKLKETNGKLEEANAKYRESEAEKEVLASKMETLLAWAKEHGYDAEAENL